MTFNNTVEKIQDFFETILSFILPKNANVMEIEAMTEAQLAEKLPHASELGENSLKALFQYKNKIVQKAIWEIKYKGNGKIMEKFSKLLYEFILEEISEEASFTNFTNPLLIPIPASKSTIRERGFNQCELIAKEIQKLDREANFEICLDALTKIKNTPHQSKLKNRAERLRNLEGSFKATDKVKGRNIILIDDVITTGATMKEAMKTLRNAGAKKILGFSIAH